MLKVKTHNWVILKGINYDDIHFFFNICTKKYHLYVYLQMMLIHLRYMLFIERRAGPNVRGAVSLFQFTIDANAR